MGTMIPPVVTRRQDRATLPERKRAAPIETRPEKERRSQAEKDAQRAADEAATPASGGGGGGGGGSSPSGAQAAGAQAPPERRGDLVRMGDYAPVEIPVEAPGPNWPLIFVGVAFAASVGFFLIRRV